MAARSAEGKAIAVGQGSAYGLASAAEAVGNLVGWGQPPLVQEGRWEGSDIAVGILLSGSGSEHSGSVARIHYEEVVPHIRWRVVGTRAQQKVLLDKGAALEAVQVDTLAD